MPGGRKPGRSRAHFRYAAVTPRRAYSRFIWRPPWNARAAVGVTDPALLTIRYYELVKQGTACPAVEGRTSLGAMIDAILDEEEVLDHFPSPGANVMAPHPEPSSLSTHRIL